MPKHCEYVQELKYLKVDVQDTLEKYTTIKEWAWIVHDKDKKEDGTLKEPHVHVYMNFGKSAATFEAVAKWFQDKPQYVCKVKGRKADVLQYLTHRNAPNKYQYPAEELHANFDVQEMIEKCEQEASTADALDQLLEDYSADLLTYAQAQQKLKDLMCGSSKWDDISRRIDARHKNKCRLATKEKRDMEIVFIYGLSGAGKSTLAEIICKTFIKTQGYRDYCRSSCSNDPLQDYMGEDILILDDFRDRDDDAGQNYTLVDVLKLLDPHFGSSFKSRFNNKCFTGKLVIITSTKHPLTWFEGEKEQRWQFFRRISMYIEATHDTVSYYYTINERTGLPCGFVEGMNNYHKIAPLHHTDPNPVWDYIKLQPAQRRAVVSIGAAIVDYMADLKTQMPETDAQTGASATEH